MSLSLLGWLSGCAAPFATTTVTQLGPPQRSERTTVIADSTSRRLLVQVDGLQVRGRTEVVQQCLRETVATRSRRDEQTVRAAPWLWAATVGGSLTSVGLVALRETQAQDLTTQAQGFVNRPTWLEISSVALAVPALVGWVALALWHGKTATVQREPVEAILRNTLIACEERPAPLLPVRVRGGRGDLALISDDNAQFVSDMRTWPARLFPWQSPFASVDCPGCAAVPLAPDASSAVALLLPRQDLDDFETWLALHPVADARATILAARDSEVVRQRASQMEALRGAQLDADKGDLIAAAIGLRRCQTLSRLPSPACDALLRTVEDRFVVGQLQLGEAAAARGDLGQLAAALYRCRLMDSDRPACRRLSDLHAQALAEAAKPRPTEVPVPPKKKLRKPRRAPHGRRGQP